MVEFDQTQALTDMGFASVTEMQKHYGLDVSGSWGLNESMAYSDFLIAEDEENRKEIQKNYKSAVSARKSAERSLDKITAVIEDLNGKISSGYEKLDLVEENEKKTLLRTLDKFVKDLGTKEKSLIPKSKALVLACEEERHALKVYQQHEADEANLRVDESYSRLESARIHMGVNEDTPPHLEALGRLKMGLKMWADNLRPTIGKI